MFGNAMRVELKSCPWGAGSVAQVGVGLWVCGGGCPLSASLVGALSGMGMPREGGGEL